MDIKLDLLRYRDNLKVSKDLDGKLYFFDPVRKKSVRALPEEMIRQLILYYLLNELKFPFNKIQVERTLIIHGNKRRYDIIVFDDNYQPFILIECKSYKVALNQGVFNQIAMYNVITQSPYLWVTNGAINYRSKYNEETNSFEFIEQIPPYPLN